VVAFVNFTPNVEELSRRLTELHIGHVIQWGKEPSAKVRAERLERFRDDPDVRVLIGTTSIERSLNLQAARYLVAVDTILNPARMQQIAGRIKRAGSAFRTVYLLTILLRHTQEAHYPRLLAREAAVSDYVWSENPSGMFERLSPLQLLQLISGDPSLGAAA
jgi:SNF2 family DNA or RNA helicase